MKVNRKAQRPSLIEILINLVFPELTASEKAETNSCETGIPLEADIYRWLLESKDSFRGRAYHISPSSAIYTALTLAPILYPHFLKYHLILLGHWGRSWLKVLCGNYTHACLEFRRVLSINVGSASSHHRHHHLPEYSRAVRLTIYIHLLLLLKTLQFLWIQFPMFRIKLIE